MIIGHESMTEYDIQLQKIEYKETEIKSIFDFATSLYSSIKYYNIY